MSLNTYFKTAERLPESGDGDNAGNVLFWDDHFDWWTERAWNCEDAMAYRLWTRMPPAPPKDIAAAKVSP